MNILKTHKIAPLHVRPGDQITVNYVEEVKSNTDVAGYLKHRLVAHDFDKPQVVDTIVVVKVENTLGLRTGTGIFLGEGECG